MENTSNTQQIQKKLPPQELRRGATFLVSALLTAILMPMLILSDSANLNGTAFFIPKLLSVLALSGIYAQVLSSYLIPAIKLLPVVSSAVALAVSAILNLSSKTPKEFEFIGLTVLFVGFILNSCVIYFCAKKGLSKTEHLIATSVCTITTGIFGMICSFIYAFGSFSVTLLKQKLDLLFDYMHKLSMDSYKLLSTSPEFDSVIKSVTGTQDVTAEEFLKIADETIGVALQALKMALPALMIVMAMLLANISILTYTAVWGISSKRSILGKSFFEFTISGFTARVFYTIMFITMLGTFIGLPAMALTVCANLMSILIFPLSHIGIRQFYRNRTANGMNKFGAFLLTSVLVTAILSFTGAFAGISLAFAGSFFILGEEAKQLPPKSNA